MIGLNINIHKLFAPIFDRYSRCYQRFTHHTIVLYLKSIFINEVDRRLKYLLEKLKIERAKLSNTTTLEGVMDEVTNNLATMS